MVNGQRTIQFEQHENARAIKFGEVWSTELNPAFEDIARYYDKANHVAFLGMWNRFRRQFLATIELRPKQTVLDVCAGTNAVGLGLLRRQQNLEVTAIDRSEAMQEVGRKSADKQGNRIESVISDVHDMPFPDNHFDIVTLQYASRHLRINRVFSEIERVLKPGGSFHHCDMLRPGNRLVEKAYYGYLIACLEITSRIFLSGAEARRQKAYFIDSLSMFYSASELTDILEQIGFTEVTAKPIFGGMIGFHNAIKN